MKVQLKFCSPQALACFPFAPSPIFFGSFSAISMMRIQNSPHLSLTLIILLLALLIQMATCRHVNHVTAAETGQGSRTKYTSMFLESISAIVSSMESHDNKIHHMHTVSRRLVPGGPNPLHN